jgi:hypothetical protein
MERDEFGDVLVGKRCEVNVNVSGLAAILMLFDYSGDFDFAIRHCLEFAREFRDEFEKSAFIRFSDIREFLGKREFTTEIAGAKRFAEPEQRYAVLRDKYATVLLLWTHTGDLEFALAEQSNFRAQFASIFNGKGGLIPRKDFDALVRSGRQCGNAKNERE